MRDHVVLYVNGARREVRGSDAFVPLSTYLRRTLGLVGTKVVCAEGDCGACTVLVARPVGGTLRHDAVNACIRFVYQLDATSVVTVEGLADGPRLHPVQERMVANHGSQCGYCTPGFVMALAPACERGACTTEAEVREVITGNLCRCTGYLPIYQSALEANGRCAGRTIDERFGGTAQVAALEQASREDFTIEAGDADGRRLHVHKPATLEAACRHRAAEPTGMVVAGATDLGVRLNKGSERRTVVLSLAGIEGLDAVNVSVGADGRRTLEIGALARWSAVESVCRAEAPAFAEMLTWFGSPQIRNVGTVGGNLANASPVADSLPFFYVCEAEITVVSARGRRIIPVDRFYRGYKQLDLAPDELIEGIRVPLPDAGRGESVRLYKASRRRHMDIATAGVGLWLRLANGRIEAARLALGGVGPTVVRARATEQWLVGRAADEETFAEAGELAAHESAPLSDVRGSAAYRRRVVVNCVRRAGVEPGPAATPSSPGGRP